jgi:hypothetical protein
MRNSPDSSGRSSVQPGGGGRAQLLAALGALSACSATAALNPEKSNRSPRGGRDAAARVAGPAPAPPLAPAPPFARRYSAPDLKGELRPSCGVAAALTQECVSERLEYICPAARADEDQVLHEQEV